MVLSKYSADYDSTHSLRERGGRMVDGIGALNCSDGGAGLLLKKSM